MIAISHKGKPWLWGGAGTFVGVALGALILNPGLALGLAPVWLLLFAAYMLVVVLATRERAPRAGRTVSPPVTAPARPEALGLSFDFPDVPSSHPAVLGQGEAVHVRVIVRAATGEPAAVRLTGQLRDGARFLAGEGVTGTDGSVTFTVRPPGVGELILDAEANANGRSIRGTTSVSVVRYEEEIERLFGEFRAYAHSVLGPDSKSDTARELAERLRSGSDARAARALLELARIYELVAYGEREADRSLYMQLVGALMVLEEGSGPERSSSAPSAGV